MPRTGDGAGLAGVCQLALQIGVLARELLLHLACGFELRARCAEHLRDAVLRILPPAHQVRNLPRSLGAGGLGIARSRLQLRDARRRRVLRCRR
eukprot:COSAG06_NODE_79_length_25437_cov_12.062673_1_plen_93_part_10